MENNNEKKTYSQEEVNSIVEQVKARQQEKFSKKIETSYVELDKYNELQNKLNEMDFNNKSTSFKETFINNGGNSNAYNDFINLNKDILNLDNEAQITKLNEIREQKPYFFNKNDNQKIEQETTTNQLNNSIDRETLIKEMLNGVNKKERVAGTIYKKPF